MYERRSNSKRSGARVRRGVVAAKPHFILKWGRSPHWIGWESINDWIHPTSSIPATTNASFLGPPWWCHLISHVNHHVTLSIYIFPSRIGRIVHDAQKFKLDKWCHIWKSQQPSASNKLKQQPQRIQHLLRMQKYATPPPLDSEAPTRLYNFAITGRNILTKPALPTQLQ